MAPTGERTARENNKTDQSTNDAAQNLWANILSEVQSSSSNKLSATKALLVLGENESGKTTLMGKLAGMEEPRKGGGLEYMYLDVKDEYRDDQTRLGVWITDGDLRHRGLLKFSMPEDSYRDRLIVLTASMTEPWALLESLQTWAEVLSTHIDRLKVNPATRKQQEDELVRQFQEYVSPDENSPMTTSTPRRATNNPRHPSSSSSGKTDEETILLPLGESTLTHNLGVPIVVVITKCDAISMLEKDHNYKEEHFDFIQQHIRKFCLNYGAALFYTSVKEEKNCELLYKYLLHRIYDLPFTTPAYVVEKDSVFIPAGWDNEKKISILYENMSSMKPDDGFEDVIIKPVTRKVLQRDVELTAEDEQLFLMKLQTQLSKQPAAGTRDSPMRPSSGSAKPPTPRAAATQGASPAAQGGSPKKPGEGRGGAPSSEGVLANFFNSLLSKKTGAGGGSPGGGASPGATRPGSGGGGSLNRDAAAAELDRMHRAKKPAAAAGAAAAANNGAVNNQTTTPNNAAS